MTDKLKRTLYLGLSALMVAPLGTSTIEPLVGNATVANAKTTKKARKQVNHKSNRKPAKRAKAKKAKPYKGLTKKEIRDLNPNNNGSISYSSYSNILKRSMNSLTPKARKEVKGMNALNRGNAKKLNKIELHHTRKGAKSADRIAGTYKGWLLYNKAHMDTDGSAKGFASYNTYLTVSTAGYNSRIASGKRKSPARDLIIPKNTNLSRKQKSAILSGRATHGLNMTQERILAHAGVPMYNGSNVYQSWKRYNKRHGTPVIHVKGVTYKYNSQNGYYSPASELAQNKAQSSAANAETNLAKMTPASTTSAKAPRKGHLGSAQKKQVSSAQSKANKAVKKASSASSKAVTSAAKAGSSAYVVNSKGSVASNSTKNTKSAANASSQASTMTSDAQSASSDDVSELASIIDSSPLAKSVANSLISDYQKNPSSATNLFLSKLNGNSKAVKNDSKLTKAVDAASESAPANDPNIQYSNNPSKAAKSEASETQGVSSASSKAASSASNKSVSSASSKASSNSSKAASGSSVANTEITNNPSDAVTGQQAKSDTSALNHVVNSLRGNKPNNSKVSNITNMSKADQEVPFTLTGAAPLTANDNTNHTVLSTDQINQLNSKPGFGNKFMAYQQGTLSDGTVVYHVISYNGKYDGWIPINEAKSGISGKYVAAPSGTYHFTDPSKDNVYSLPLGTSFKNPYISQGVTKAGADNLQILGAREVNRPDNKGSKLSYYIKDFSNPSVDGWVSSDELSQKKASNAKPTTPVKTGTNASKLSLHIEGSQNEAPVGVDNGKAGSDSLNLPKTFANTQVKALKGNKGAALNWRRINKKFFNRTKDMHKIEGTSYYYDNNGKAISIPKSQVAQARQQGKKVFHYKYKIDKAATLKANPDAKYGDVINVYYKQVRVYKPAKTKKATTPSSAVITNQNTTNKGNTVNKVKGTNK